MDLGNEGIVFLHQTATLLLKLLEMISETISEYGTYEIVVSSMMTEANMCIVLYQTHKLKSLYIFYIFNTKTEVALQILQKNINIRITRSRTTLI